MKAVSLVLALLLTGTVIASAFDDEPTLQPDRFPRRTRSAPAVKGEDFDHDYDTRPSSRAPGNGPEFHPVFDLIKVNIVHVIHKDDKHVQALQLPAVRVVSGRRAMVRVNDRRYRVFAAVKPSGKVDVDLAFLSRGPYSAHSTLLAQRKFTLPQKRTVAFLSGKDEFRISAEVSSREDNQWLHSQQRSTFGSYNPSFD